MSTSMLYRIFGVRDYRYVRTKYIPGGMILTIERKAKTCCCAACGSRNVRPQGAVQRPIRTLPIGCKSVTLLAKIPRVACDDCGKTRQVAIGFADNPASFTTWLNVLGPLRELSLGLILAGVVLALVTIGNVLRFQFDRVT